MILWIASYPKSGNTWLRALISSYYYSKDGVFNESLLPKIDQFPTKKYLNNFNFDKNIIGDTCKYWIKAQEEINREKKIRFFKTHSAFGKINNYDFTNKKNSIGCIYIVRDPRNVFTSIKNHYELDDEKALKWMTNDKQFLYNVEKVKEDGFSDFQFISSWNMNYISWKVQKKIPLKFIRYEDLLNQTYAVFVDILKFINTVTNNSETINKSKVKTVLKTTIFEKLKQNENEKGFSEAIPSQSNKSKKIPFFNLGPKNDWKKILDRGLKEKLGNIFNKDIKDLSY